MRICFISTMGGAPWGGSEELWYHCAIAALREGHQVIVQVFHWDTEPAQVTELRKKGAVILKRNRERSIAERLKLRMLNIAGLSVTASFAKKIKDFNPDRIVISQSMTFDAAHDEQLHRLMSELTCRFYLISQQNADSGGIMHTRVRMATSDFVRKAAVFFFVSERNKVTGERQLVHPIKNYQLISNPVNIRHVGIKPFPEMQGTLRLACVARLQCAYKGQDILLQTLSTQIWRNRDYQLSLYGTGPDEEYLKALIQYYHLEDKVFLKGHVSDIDQIWTNHHVAIQPSLIEGTPLAMVEAMLSGRAVIGSDVGGMSNYIVDERTGFLLEVASQNCLLKTLEKVWAKKNSLQEMGELAFAHAKAITDLSPEKTMLEIISAR